MTTNDLTSSLLLLTCNFYSAVARADRLLYIIVLTMFYTENDNYLKCKNLVVNFGGGRFQEQSSHKNRRLHYRFPLYSSLQIVISVLLPNLRPLDL